MDKLYAFDIDGTVADTYRVMCKTVGSHMKCDFSQTPMPYDPHMHGYPITGQEVMAIFNTLALTDSIPPMPGAIEVLKKYYEQTKRLVFITHRNNRDVVTQTRQWLANYLNLPYELYACYKCEKSDLAEELGVNGFIDDVPDICDAFYKKGMSVLLFSSPWHIYINNHHHLPVVNNWEEIGRIIL